MLSPLIRVTLSRYRDLLAERFGARLRRVCVFGSWARGQATESSDLDVAVVVDDLTQAEWKQAIAIGADVQLALECPFSPLVVSTERFERLKAGGGIGAQIEHDGISA
jgi:predicted nucleotidyltransferase